MTYRIHTAAAVVTGALGRRASGAVLYLVDLTVFVIGLLRVRPGLFNRATYNSVIAQLIFSGVDALPAITLLATAVGATVTTQLILLMELVGDEAEVIGMLTRIIGLELSPLLIAIIVIGRTGSAITVDLGNMKLHREVEGLALLGIDVQDFFVAPRLAGVAISQLVLAVYFAVIAVTSGIFFSAIAFSMTQLKYLLAIPLAFDPLDLVTFAAKNLLFGIITGATACYHGLRVTSSPTEVPQETQRSIVNAMVMIFLLDGLIAVALS